MGNTTSLTCQPEPLEESSDIFLEVSFLCPSFPPFFLFALDLHPKIWGRGKMKRETRKTRELLVRKIMAQCQRWKKFFWRFVSLEVLSCFFFVSLLLLSPFPFSSPHFVVREGRLLDSGLDSNRKEERGRRRKERESHRLESSG